VSSECARIDNRGNDSIYIRFARSDCGPSPSRSLCTRPRTKYPRRGIAIRPREQYAALQQRHAAGGHPRLHPRLCAPRWHRRHHFTGGVALRNAALAVSRLGQSPSESRPDRSGTQFRACGGLAGGGTSFTHPALSLRTPAGSALTNSPPVSKFFAEESTRRHRTYPTSRQA
jgi:hypothetical protein